ncbi:hypothetical protein HJB78_16580 [Rhizobium lentis]|uniref:hypothetical protein n=1 Tax=Rhizobium lentis TaxID=1138194 RepID=UPI001C83C2F1|nr:hypothetical protein [Rhizobium lentis]MBX5152588.1 hypothetical protein [Rhizobium lentis]
MSEATIRKLVREAMPKLKLMSRAEIRKAHADGLPGVYMRGDEIVWEYPTGDIVDLVEHRRRNAEAMAAQVNLRGGSDMTEDEIDELVDCLVKEVRSDC